MATHLGPGSISSALSPLLSTIIARDGILVDPDALAFAVFEVNDETAPVTVVPRTNVNLTTDRIGVGRYAALWTVPGGATPGRYIIRWYATFLLGEPEVTWAEVFDVLASGAVVPPPGISLYTLVSSVRAEGVPSTMKDSRILLAIRIASERLAYWTGRDFLPRFKQIDVDGWRGPALILGEPIVALESVSSQSSELFSTSSLDLKNLKVYNRHLTQGLRFPDDRDVPRIEMGGTYGRWSSDHAPQAVRLRGVFGYTDPDGSPAGATPADAEYVVMRVALNELPQQNTSAASDKKFESQVVKKKTREQEIMWGSGSSTGEGGGFSKSGDFTGDPTIDSIIHRLSKPLAAAVV